MGSEIETPLFGPSVPVKNPQGQQVAWHLCTALAILTNTKYNWHFLEEAELRDLVQTKRPSFAGEKGVQRLRVLYYRACKGPEEGWASDFTPHLRELREWLVTRWGEEKVKRLEDLFGIAKKPTPKEEEIALLKELEALDSPPEKAVKKAKS